MRGKYILMLILAAFAVLTVLACLVTIVEKSEPSTALSASQAEAEASEDPIEVSTPETPSPSPSPISWSYTTPSPSPSSSPSPPPVSWSYTTPSPSPSPISWSYTTPSLSPSAENSASAEYVPYVSRGIREDGTYKNNFSGIKFTLPEGWEVLTDEEMAAFYELSPEVYSSDESWQKEVQTDGTIVPDILLVETETCNSITFYFQKIAEYEKGMDFLDELHFESEYEKLYKSTLDTLSYDYSFDNDLIPDYDTLHFRNDELEYSFYVIYNCKMNFAIAAIVMIFDDSGKTLDEVADEFGFIYNLSLN